MGLHPVLALALQFLLQTLQLPPRLGDALIQIVEKRGVILKTPRRNPAAAFLLELIGVLAPEQGQLL